MNKPLSEKILVLGVDGMDPRLTKRFLAEGMLPNVQKLIDMGACRDDLEMLGGMPTITPPMWTSLATGSNPNSHGITCFWRQHPEEIETLVYNLDSRLCKDECVWDVFAENNKKTLVWHWPGSSWPPTSDSPNLHVVDGTQPSSVQGGSNGLDMNKMCRASKEITKFAYKAQACNDNGAGCIIHDLPELDPGLMEAARTILGGKEVRNIMLSHDDGELAFDKVPFDVINSPIKAAEGWENAPEGALEFIFSCNSNMVRRHSLILKNEQGVYDHIAVYGSKKDKEPLAVVQTGEMLKFVVDENFTDTEGNKITATYYLSLLKLAEDGSDLYLSIGGCSKVEASYVWHPKSLHDQVIDNVGYIPSVGSAQGYNPELIQKLCIPAWENYCNWQADALLYLIKENKYDLVMSHIHNVDAQGHAFWFFAKNRAHLGQQGDVFYECIKEVYRQTDRYLGRFIPLAENGWSIIVTSDHGFLVAHEDETPLTGDAFGCNIMMLRDMGYAELKKDAEGNPLKEIDWSKTRAVAPRGNHIYLNIKGRDPHGIVDPTDQYELERQLISDLYSYRQDGKRVVGLAMRNKDAAIVGMGGPECGDIVYFLEEGFNRGHGDSITTTYGDRDTSVMPIFIAAGQGIKKGCKIRRTIRTNDVAPTISALAGLRMPADCEGAPIYQILND